MGTSMPCAQDRDEGAWLEVKVIPGARRTRILGLRDERVYIAVNAQPEKGKANRALLKFLAKAIGVPRTSMQILTGETSHRKRILITGLKAAEVLNRLIGQ